MTLDDVSVWELLEAAPDGLVLVSDDGLIAFVNRQLEQMAGFDRSTLLGQELEILVPDALRVRHRQLHAGYRVTPRVRMMGVDLRLDMRRADGSTMPVEISLAPISIGSSVMTAASVRDVTAQRSADRERQRLLRLLDLDPDAVFVVDAVTARIEYANSGAVSLLGYSRKELTSMTLFEISPLASEARRQSLLEEHVRSGPSHRHILEVIRRAKDGTDIPCDSHGQLVTSDGVQKFVLVDRDARLRLLAERMKTRQSQLTELVSRVTSMVLADFGSQAVYQEVADGTAQLVDSENACMVLRDPTTGRFSVAAAAGPLAQLFMQDGRLLNQEDLAEWYSGGGMLSVDRLSERVPDHLRILVGPAAAVRFPQPKQLDGLIVAVRGHGSEPFAPTTLDLLKLLAPQVATVVELGRARAAQHRLALAEDRERIARDLHDTVIQDLIGIGLQIANGLPSVDPKQRRRDGELLDRLDEIVRRLRSVVFGSRTHVSSANTTQVVERMAAEAARVLGHRPLVRADEALNDLPAVVTEQLIPALREALSNVARHASATATSVTIEVDTNWVTLFVDDNGTGPGVDPAGTGVTNMQERARMLGGSAALVPLPHGGSRLQWSARLGPGEVVAGETPP